MEGQSRFAVRLHRSVNCGSRLQCSGWVSRPLLCLRPMAGVVHVLWYQFTAQGFGFIYAVMVWLAQIMGLLSLCRVAFLTIRLSPRQRLRTTVLPDEPLSGGMFLFCVLPRTSARSVRALVQSIERWWSLFCARWNERRDRAEPVPISVLDLCARVMPVTAA